MLTVNEYMVRDLLTPLGGTADVDEKIYQYQNVDSDDELEIKKIIEDTIKPYYEKQSSAYKESARRSLAYFLTTNRINFGAIYDSCLIAFDHPTDARLFFLWIWDILYPKDDYHIRDVKQYSEIDDINEGNRY